MNITNIPKNFKTNGTLVYMEIRQHKEFDHQKIWKACG